MRNFVGVLDLNWQGWYSKRCEMATGGLAVEDALFQQARDVHGKEFEDWASSMKSTLQLNDRGSNCLTLLRQMFVLTTVTKYTRNLSSAVYNLLQSVVLEPEQGSTKLRLLAAAILRELAPSPYITVKDFSPPIEERNVPYVLPVLLAQGNVQDRLSTLASSHIFRWLTQPGYEDELPRHSLSCLHALSSHGQALELLSENQVRSISTQVSVWLRHASRSSLSAQASTGISLFSSSAKKQMLPVREIDGSTSPDIFTILSLGGYYSPDQLLNIHAFSFLRRWLLTTLVTSTAAPSPSPAPTPTSEHRRVTPSPVPTSGRSVHPFVTSLPSPLPSPLPHTFTASLTASMATTSHTKQGLCDAAVQYCLRVIDQSERKPIKSSDEELATACLYEAISILDILCSIRPSLMPGVFPTMRKLYNRHSTDPTSHGRVLLALVRFFLHHGQSEMYDIENPITTFFGQVLASKFNDPGLAYDTVEFLLGNTHSLLHSTHVFTKYVPNLLKILAWAPMTFIAEFLQLLPAFISKTTASEVLHSLLDLPCLAATLQAQHLVNAAPNITDHNLLPQYNRCLASFQDPAHRLMFGHFLRSETGRGDTIDRLGNLHLLLSDFSHHQRVIGASEVAPLLVRMFFKTVLHGDDKALISQLVPVLIERTVMLYDILTFQAEMRRVIAEQLLVIFHQYPPLVGDYCRDIADYLRTMRNLTAAGEHCYVTLVWIVGEYTHSGYDSRCTSSLLVELFETLEPVTYEVALNLHRQRDYTTRLMLVLMGSVAKIASRCHDLIPRALLCLNKIVQLGKESSLDDHTHQTLLIRANELVNVLKIPSIASAILSHTSHSSPQQELQRQTDTAYLLRATAFHLES